MIQPEVINNDKYILETKVSQISRLDFIKWWQATLVLQVAKVQQCRQYTENVSDLLVCVSQNLHC